MIDETLPPDEIPAGGSMAPDAPALPTPGGSVLANLGAGGGGALDALPGLLANAFQHTVGYVTRDPALSAQADARQAMADKFRLLLPVAAVKGQIMQRMARQDYE